MRAGRGAEVIGHLDGAGHGGAESDTIVSAGHVIVHRLGDGHHIDPLLVEVNAIAQRVVAADGDQIVDTQVVEVLEDLGGEIVHFSRVGFLKVLRDPVCRDVTGTRAGGMQEGAAGAPRLVYNFLCQYLVVIAVICVLIAQDPDGARPAAADANNLVPLADGADGDGADRRIQPGDIAPTGQDGDNALVFLSLCHRFSPGMVSAQQRPRRRRDMSQALTPGSHYSR